MSPRRRQFSDSEELQSWKNIFRTGRDYWGAAEDLGLEPLPYHKVDRAASEAAWRKLGRRYLDEIWPIYCQRNPRAAPSSFGR